MDGPSRISRILIDESRLPLPIMIDSASREGDGYTAFSDEWKGRKLDIVPAQGSPFEEWAAQLLESSRVYHMEGGISYNEKSLSCDGEILDVEVLPLPRLFFSFPVKFARYLSTYLDLNPANPPLYAPGCADSRNLELLHYLGFEVFDTVRARIDASENRYYTASGMIEAGSFEGSLSSGDICGCDHCGSSDQTLEELAGHNVGVMRHRLRESLFHLERGDLRTHLMGKLSGDPEMASLLRSFEGSGCSTETDNCWTWRKNGKSLVAYRDDLMAPDYRLWLERIQGDFSPLPHKDTLLIVPCSAKKPYSRSRTHTRIRSYLSGIKGWQDRVQMLVLTSPLGGVPMELEDLYPAAHYDIPVTGTWFPEEIERSRKVTRSVMNSGRFRYVIDFHPEGKEFFPEPGEFFREAEYRGVHGDGDRLREVVSDLMGIPWDGCQGSSRTIEVLNLIRFSMGSSPCYDPKMRIMKRRGRTYLSRGKELLFELGVGGPKPTLEGGRLIWNDDEGSAKKVFIDDFVPRGTVFTQGIVGTQGVIRPGDIVVVGHGNDYRGVGRSNMSSSLLKSGISGPGVKMISYESG